MMVAQISSSHMTCDKDDHDFLLVLTVTCSAI